MTFEPNTASPRAWSQRTRPLRRLLPWLLPWLAWAGCNAFSVKTPDSFVSLKRYRTALTYKAVAADNTVISIRSFEAKDHGTLAYWSDIVRREMVLRKGYALKETDSVKTGNGRAGTLMIFSTRSGRTKYSYAVALFVTKGYVHAVEMAAKADRFPAHKPGLDEVIASFRPR